ncbi:hypothetical protein H4R19_001907 [Coemansia spiralis]|nr:hypothetical protein H4R19_001907 [Coemansia spiralis]
MSDWQVAPIGGENLPTRLLSRSQSTRRRASVRRGRALDLRPQSIARVDPPPALDTSIHVIDTLFKQYRQSDYSEADDAGSSPTSLVPSGRSSLDSDGTLAEPAAVAAVAADHLDDKPTVCTARDTDAADEDHALLGQLMEALFPWPQPGSEPYHVYYIVATLNMQPAIPRQYPCPTAMCTGRFVRFEDLQQHWPTHPWNRRGALVPVAAGGIRRLTFWQHKAIYIRSLLQTRAASDNGDVRLFGPKSYFVSPRIVPIELVRAWEASTASQQHREHV